MKETDASHTPTARLRRESMQFRFPPYFNGLSYSRLIVQTQLGSQYKKYANELEEYVSSHLEHVDAAVESCGHREAPRKTSFDSARSSPTFSSSLPTKAMTISMSAKLASSSLSSEYLTFGPGIKSPGKSNSITLQAWYSEPIRPSSLDFRRRTRHRRVRPLQDRSTKIAYIR